MTYGHWIQTAQTHLERAHREMRTRTAGDVSEIVSTLAARGRVYRQMIRLTGLLTDVPHGTYTVDLSSASATLAATKPSAASMLDGMQAAGRSHDGNGGNQRRPTGVAGRNLAAAAQKLATAGDILASHVPPGRAPYTPEGAAIRIGAGGAAALGDIARLLRTQILVDEATPAWLGDTVGRTSAWEPLLDPVRWAPASGLADVATTLMNQGAGQPPLLNGLGPAGAPHPPDPEPIRNAQDAADRVTAVCEWLYRNPDQVRVSHLSTGAQLGTAICLLPVRSAPSQLSPAWTEAAITARHLRGSPARPEGQRVIDEMRQLISWLRDRPRLEGVPSGAARAGLERAAVVLPLLAEVLRRGAGIAVRRGDVFTVAGQLQRQPGALIWHATGQWRVATPTSKAVAALDEALAKASFTGPVRGARMGSRIARRGFLPLVAVVAHGQLNTAPAVGAGRPAMRSGRAR